jgi:hypothetical protein
MKILSRLASISKSLKTVCNYYIFLAFFALFTQQISAQNADSSEIVHSCTQYLINAEDAYSKGQIEKVSEMLSPCLEKGFSKDEKKRALRLITLCHLYYNQDTAAAVSMLHMLRNFPEYKIDSSLDPAEFVALYKTFRTRPLFIIGVKGGLSFVNLYRITNYNDLNSGTYKGSYRLDKPSCIGLSVETPFYEKFSLVYEFYYKNFQYSFHNMPLSYATIDMKETDASLDVPVMAQYSFLKKDIIPYINAGFSVSYLLSSKANFTRNDKELDQARGPFVYETDLTSQRKRFNCAMTFGAGVRVKNIISNGYLSLDVRYSRYFLNQINPDTRASDPKITYDFLYTDNALKIENFSILLGFKIPIYVPKQKRNVRLKPAH